MNYTASCESSAKAHYVAASYDGLNFCIRDPGIGRLVDGFGDRLDFVVRTADTGSERVIPDLWVTLVQK